jgi:hypothetical protein
MLVTSSSKGLAMKIAIKNQTRSHQLAITSEIQTGSASSIADFSEVRHHLIVANRETDNIQKVPLTCASHNRSPASSLISSERIEAVLYWFFSAPALFYLIYLIIRPLLGVVS